MAICRITEDENSTRNCWGSGETKFCSDDQNLNWTKIIKDGTNLTWKNENGGFYSFPIFQWNSSSPGDIQNTSLYFSLLFPFNQTFLANSDSHQEEGKSFLVHFNQSYQQYHGYTSFLVCLFGIAANLINITVLTRRNMISPTNFILTALAVSDLMTMMSYLPYAVYFHFISAPDKLLIHPEGWIVYMLLHTLFIITTHTISMWLTVALALFRYVVVCHPIHGPVMCTLARAKQSISVIVIITVISCSPHYIMYHTCQQKNGGYWFEINHFIADEHKIFNFWMFGVVLKVVPCILLSVLSALLLRAMAAQNAKRKLLLQKKSRVSISKATGNFIKSNEIQAKQQGQQQSVVDADDDEDLDLKKMENKTSQEEMKREGENKIGEGTHHLQIVEEEVTTKLNTSGERSATLGDPSGQDSKSLRASRRKTKEPASQRKLFQSSAAQERDRTTCMLVVVVLCFVIIELPQGILALMSGVNKRIFDEVYVQLGDLMDILVLINSSVNFILYCTMSAKFRSTFKEIFIKRWLK